MYYSSKSKFVISIETLVGLYILLAIGFEDSALHVIPNALYVIIVFLGLMRGCLTKKLDGYKICLFTFAIITFLSYIWSWDRDITVLECKRQIIYILFIYAFTYFMTFSCSMDNLIRWYIATGLIVSIYLISQSGIAGLIRQIISSVRVTNDYFQVNEVGGLMSTVIVMSIFMYLEKRKKHYLFYLIPMALILLAGESKRAFLMLAVSIVIMFLIRSRNVSFEKKILLLLLFVVAGYGVMYIFQNASMFSGISSRFSDFFNLFQSNKYADDTRIKIYMSGIESIKESPWFGKGAGCSHYATLNAVGRKTYLHNNYLEILVNLGIVGFIAYYGMYAYLIIRLIRIHNTNKYGELMLIVMISQLISDIAITSYYSKVTYILMAMAYAVLWKNEYQLDE